MQQTIGGQQAVTKAKHYLKNLSSSWVGCAANVVVLLFLSRFVVRSLGEEIYGIWAWIVSLTGTMGLIDVGMRYSLGRYINYYLGQEKIDKVNGVISTALTFFVLVTPVIFVVAFLFGTYPGLIFKDIPLYLHGDVKVAMLLAGLNLCLGLVVAPFSLVVTSHERFEIANLTNLGSLAIRAIGTVVLLEHGGGIVSLAAVQVASSLFSVVIFVITSKRVFRELCVRLSLTTFATFRELFGFGKWAFLAAIASKLLFSTDIIVIGYFFGPTEVALYSIPLTMINASRDFVGQVTEILAPKTIKLSSKKDIMALRLMLKWGSKFTMFFAIPVFSGLIFFGPRFMELLWGPEFSGSKWVLIILAIPQFFNKAIRIGGSIISGLGHIRFAALITLGQGIVNLILTLVFVMVLKWGIEGVALGTLIPMILFDIYVVWILHRWLDASVGMFLKNNVIRWVLATVGVFVYGQGLKVALFELPYEQIQLAETWGGFLFVTTLYIVGAVGITWFLSFHQFERDILSEEINTLIPDRLKRNLGQKGI